jgi:hypothetical protein
MPIQWTPESEYVKELAKWEIRPTALVSAEMIQALGRPLVPPFQEYPKALYRAKAATGGPTINGYIVAQDEAHERRLLGQGWSLSQEAAIEAVLAHDTAVAQAAAERAFVERRMSDRARAEARAADEATPAHVPVVPVTPIKKRRPYVRKAKETS